MMKQILVQYYNNNARKLRKLVDGILAGFSGWSNKDVDDFYSLANEVFVERSEEHTSELQSQR